MESIPNKYKQEIADKLKEASYDEMKMQELAKELRDRKVRSSGRDNRQVQIRSREL